MCRAEQSKAPRAKQSKAKPPSHALLRDVTKREAMDAIQKRNLPRQDGCAGAWDKAWDAVWEDAGDVGEVWSSAWADAWAKAWEAGRNAAYTFAYGWRVGVGRIEMWAGAGDRAWEAVQALINPDPDASDTPIRDIAELGAHMALTKLSEGHPGWDDADTRACTRVWREGWDASAWPNDKLEACVDVAKLASAWAAKWEAARHEVQEQAIDWPNSSCNGQDAWAEAWVAARCKAWDGTVAMLHHCVSPPVAPDTSLEPSPPDVTPPVRKALVTIASYNQAAEVVGELEVMRSEFRQLSEAAGTLGGALNDMVCAVTAQMLQHTDGVNPDCKVTFKPPFTLLDRLDVLQTRLDTHRDYARSCIDSAVSAVVDAKLVLRTRSQED